MRTHRRGIVTSEDTSRSLRRVYRTAGTEQRSTGHWNCTLWNAATENPIWAKLKREMHGFRVCGRCSVLGYGGARLATQWTRGSARAAPAEYCPPRAPDPGPRAPPSPPTPPTPTPDSTIWPARHPRRPRLIRYLNLNWILPIGSRLIFFCRLSAKQTWPKFRNGVARPV